MSVACFLLLLSCRDAIDIGCIDRAITATLETARVSGGVSVWWGDGQDACVRGVGGMLQRRENHSLLMEPSYAFRTEA